MPIRIKQNQFAGAKGLYGKQGLGEVIRGLAIDNARNKIAAMNVPALTDNSTGTAGSKVVDLVVPSDPFNATSADGASRTAFNTAVGKLNNAGKVLTNSVNNVRAKLGLPAVAQSFGTQATADTLPALDKTVAAATGTSALDYTEGVGAMTKVKTNQRKLVRAINEVLVAIGETPVASAMTGVVSADTTNSDPGTAAASATGAKAVSKAAADAFLTGAANNVATIAAKWNAVFDGSAFVSDPSLRVIAG